MDDRLYGVVDTFRVNAALMKKFTEDLEESEWSYAGTKANSIAWIAGHVTLSRKTILKTLGAANSVSAWEAMVKRGSEKGRDDLTPFRDEIVASYFDAVERADELLEQVTAAQLDEKIGRKLPNGSDTVLGMLSFIAFHEAYHLGQISMLRIELGKKTIG